MRMRAMKTANPALNEKLFTDARVGINEEAMSISGTVYKTAFLTLIVFTTAALNWYLASIEHSLFYPLMIGGGIGGLILAIITIFNKKAAHITAVLYAALEGLLLGGISYIANELVLESEGVFSQMGGVVFPAVMLTFSVLFIMLFIYRTGIIKVTQNFRLGVAAATGAVFFVYLISMVLNFVGGMTGSSLSIPLIHESGPVGIIFSLVVCAIAAVNLVLDFDFIEKGAEYGAPKYMEWYAAFGLMVTLIWLYIEILRLLSKINNR